MKAQTARAAVIPFKEAVDFEDIPCLLNPVQTCDLKQILLLTPDHRRVDVALAFSGLVAYQLFRKAGFTDNKSYKCCRRWFSGEVKLPLGAAFRFAAVFGVPAEILFSSPKWRER